ATSAGGHPPHAPAIGRMWRSVADRARGATGDHPCRPSAIGAWRPIRHPRRATLGPARRTTPAR
ncbi:hypothetical protein ACFXMT_49830, partial [Streptomyces mirabilis]|uniref:hypothetical protein n=1 Tax=Streptomyces mirabilis TaxID=68239 RepID=UPI0036B39088